MRFAFVTSIVLWSLIIWGVTSLGGCVTSEPQKPKYEPIPFREEPDVAPAVPMADTPDDIFNREVDACFVEYRKCQATGAGESVCFPPQEKCVITAYRKLKKARGE